VPDSTPSRRLVKPGRPCGRTNLDGRAAGPPVTVSGTVASPRRWRDRRPRASRPEVERAGTRGERGGPVADLRHGGHAQGARAGGGADLPVREDGRERDRSARGVTGAAAGGHREASARVDARERQAPRRHLRDGLEHLPAGRDALVRPDHGDADGAGVEAAGVRADDGAAGAAGAALPDGAEAVDEAGCSRGRTSPGSSRGRRRSRGAAAGRPRRRSRSCSRCGGSSRRGRSRRRAGLPGAATRRLPTRRGCG
jgi:hypothetical protein